MHFIVPAIVTLIISITSGLMLDYYKNLAPKILGNVRNGTPKEINGKKNSAYIINVSNPSNKTIHELTLNIQSSQINLKSKGATITKGLKFESSMEDNFLEVYIPFLSKGDKFSVMVYAENQDAVHNKPVLVIRSPEKFNQIDSVGQKTNRSLWFNIPKNINQVILTEMQKIKEKFSNTKSDFTTVMSKETSDEQAINKKDRPILPGNKKLSKSKKVMIITVSIILVIVTGALEKFYFTGKSTKVATPTKKTIVPKQSTGEAGSVGGTTENTDATKSTNGNPGSTKSTGGTTENKEAGGTTENKEAGGTTENKGAGSTTENKGAGSTTENKEAGSTTENKGAGSTTENKEAGSTTENKEAGSTTENKGTGGTTENKEAGGTTENKESGGTTETKDTGGTTETNGTGATTGATGN